MIITGVIHLIDHFSTPDLDSADKLKLYELMNSIQFEFDPIFSRSAMNLFDAFSLFLTVMLLTLGIVNLLILKSAITTVQ